MTAIRYTARRSISSGHSVDAVYELNLTCSDLTRSRQPVINGATALDGTDYSLRYRADVFWSVSLTPVNLTDIALINEFLDSVENKEQFEFDPYGSVGDSPDAMRSVVIAGSGYTENRRVRRGDGGQNDLFIVSFRVREL